MNGEENLTTKLSERRGIEGDKDDFSRIIAIDLHRSDICVPFIDDAVDVISTCGHASCNACSCCCCCSVEGVRFSMVHDAAEIRLRKLAQGFSAVVPCY